MALCSGSSRAGTHLMTRQIRPGAGRVSRAASPPSHARPAVILAIVALLLGAEVASAQVATGSGGAGAVPTASGADIAPPMVPAGTVEVAPARAEPAVRGRAVPGSLPHNLSPWGMFVNADVVVQAVMVGLAFASVMTWTVWLAKSLELLGAIRAARGLLDRVTAAPSLQAAVGEAGTSRSPVALLLGAAADEAELSAGLDKEGVKERVASRLDRIEAAAARRVTRGTGLLATIGSTAPFVGLFGTVWGIMNSFIGISKSQTTSLAVVAPGIAEALLATAIGLIAAIPAVVIYNLFARWISGYRALLSDASAAVMRHLSRDLDRVRRPQLRAAE